MLYRSHYLNLSPQQRKKGAALIRSRLMAALSSPGLGPQQIKHLHAELKKINAWEAGLLPVKDAP